jgi:hypothetical protein
MMICEECGTINPFQKLLDTDDCLQSYCDGKMKELKEG